MLGLGAQHAAYGPEKAGAEGPGGQEDEGGYVQGPRRVLADSTYRGEEQHRDAEYGDEMPPGKAPGCRDRLAEVELSRRSQQSLLDGSLHRPNGRRDLSDRHVGAKGPSPLKGQAHCAAWRYADLVSHRKADGDAKQSDGHVGDEAAPGDCGGCLESGEPGDRQFSMVSLGAV